MANQAFGEAAGRPEVKSSSGRAPPSNLDEFQNESTCYRRIKTRLDDDQRRLEGASRHESQGGFHPPGAKSSSGGASLYNLDEFRNERNVIGGQTHDSVVTRGARKAPSDQTWPTRLPGSPSADQKSNPSQAKRPRPTSMSSRMDRNAIKGIRSDSTVTGSSLQAPANQTWRPGSRRGLRPIKNFNRP